jgi:hypothetical protein
VSSEERIQLCAPSEWDIVLSPELAPLFVIDAAIVAAQRFLSITLDPTSSSLGGTDHPLTSELLDGMSTLRVDIRRYRLAVAVEQDLGGSVDLDQDCLSRDGQIP